MVDEYNVYLQLAFQVMEEMKLILGKSEKEFDKLKRDAKKVFLALEKMAPKNYLTSKVR